MGNLLDIAPNAQIPIVKALQLETGEHNTNMQSQPNRGVYLVEDIYATSRDRSKIRGDWEGCSQSRMSVSSISIPW